MASKCPVAGAEGGGQGEGGSGGAAATLRLTLAELAEYDGTKREDKMILVSIRGRLYDVGAGRAMYGPGGECMSVRQITCITVQDPQPHVT